MSPCWTSFLFLGYEVCCGNKGVFQDREGCGKEQLFSLQFFICMDPFVGFVTGVGEIRVVSPFFFFYFCWAEQHRVGATTIVWVAISDMYCIACGQGEGVGKDFLKWSWVSWQNIRLTSCSAFLLILPFLHKSALAFLPPIANLLKSLCSRSFVLRYMS